MSDSKNNSDSNSRSILSRIEQFLLDERARFGETLIVESPMPPGVQPMTRPSSDPADEPLLFDVPPQKARHAEAWENAASLSELDAMICNCLKCPLGNSRTKFVFGVGNPSATLMLIGEAPG